MDLQTNCGNVAIVNQRGIALGPDPDVSQWSNANVDQIGAARVTPSPGQTFKHSCQQIGCPVDGVRFEKASAPTLDPQVFKWCWSRRPTGAGGVCLDIQLLEAAMQQYGEAKKVSSHWSSAIAPWGRWRTSRVSLSTRGTVLGEVEAQGA